MPEICTEDYLLNFFETIYFERRGIQRIDDSLLQMNNLVVLNLSFNKLTSLEYVPKTLKELYLTGNQISNIADEVQTNLVHIGLGYNCIDYYMFVRLCRVFPNLFCLDLSYNNVSDLTYVISGLKDLASLKMLYLTGNPVSLTPRYRDIMK
jgi:Leucine-rich repeat (LRR) protein